MKGACADLASVDKRLDMMRTHRVMAILADDRYRFCGCNPVGAHDGTLQRNGKEQIRGSRN